MDQYGKIAQTRDVSKQEHIHTHVCIRNPTLDWTDGWGRHRTHNDAQVEFSPFHARRLAVATAQYFGIIGNGRCVVRARWGRMHCDISDTAARGTSFRLCLSFSAHKHTHGSRQYVLELGLDGILHVVRDFLTQEVGSSSSSSKSAGVDGCRKWTRGGIGRSVRVLTD